MVRRAVVVEREGVLSLCSGIAAVVLKAARKPVEDLVAVWPGDVVAVLDRQHRTEEPRVEDRVEGSLVAGPTAESLGVVGDKRQVGPRLEVGNIARGNR